MEDAWFIIKMIVVFALGIFGLISGVQGVNLAFFDNVPVRVSVDDKIVYQGISGCVSVESSGANSTVSVNQGFLCFFPKAYYVSKNVSIENLKF